MTARRAGAVLVAGSVLVGVVASAGSAAAAPSLWDQFAAANRQRCGQLVEEAGRLAARDARAAVQTLRAVGERCADDRDALQSAGEELLRLHQFSDGRLVLERARTLADQAPPSTGDRDAALAFHLGFAREVTGDLEGAIDEHRRLEAMGGLPPPNRYLVHYDLGDELMAAGRLGEAIDEYRRAVALSTDKPVPRLALAVALDRDGQRDRARAEAAIAVTLDPDLRQLASDEYVFVPPADQHYYRAVALLARGNAAEARLALRAFLRDLPDGPYAALATERLAELERLVDPRELEVSGTGLDTRGLAGALGPAVAALESCLPDGRVVRLKLTVARSALHADPAYPAAGCLNAALAQVQSKVIPLSWHGAVVLPLAGRRSAPSHP